MRNLLETRLCWGSKWYLKPCKTQKNQFKKPVGETSENYLTKPSVCNRIIFVSAADTVHCSYADVAELADALDLGSSGRPWGFKSLHPHLEENGLNVDFTAFDLFFVAWKIDDFLVPFGSIVLHGR